VGVQDDEDAFAANLQLAVDPAFRVLRGLGLSPDDAADVLQEASIRAWRHRAQCRGDFRMWFVAIASREARRPRHRWLTVPVFWSVRSGQPAEEQAADGLAWLLRRLPDGNDWRYRCGYGADLSTAGVAQVMRISEPAAKQLLARARESLRQALANETNEVGT